MLVYLTKAYQFNAGHRLFDPRKDDAWNLQVFGKCSFAGGHGHNYRLEVSVRGEPHPESGLVVPGSVIDEAVQVAVMDRIDHRNLNRCPVERVWADSHDGGPHPRALARHRAEDPAAGAAPPPHRVGDVEELVRLLRPGSRLRSSVSGWLRACRRPEPPEAVVEILQKDSIVESDILESSTHSRERLAEAHVVGRVLGGRLALRPVPGDVG
jgi:hypothetical protein